MSEVILIKCDICGVTKPRDEYPEVSWLMITGGHLCATCSKPFGLAPINQIMEPDLYAHPLFTTPLWWLRPDPNAAFRKSYACFDPNIDSFELPGGRHSWTMGASKRTALDQKPFHLKGPFFYNPKFPNTLRVQIDRDAPEPRGFVVTP